MERFNQIFAFSPNYELVANVSTNTVGEQYSDEVTLNPIEYAHTKFHPGASLISINIKNDLKLSCKDKSDAYIIQYISGSKIEVKELVCSTGYSILAGAYTSKMPLQRNTDIVISVPDYLELAVSENIPNYRYLTLDRAFLKVRDGRKNIVIHSSLTFRELYTSFATAASNFNELPFQPFRQRKIPEGFRQHELDYGRFVSVHHSCEHASLALLLSLNKCE